MYIKTIMISIPIPAICRPDQFQGSPNLADPMMRFPPPIH